MNEISLTTWLKAERERLENFAAMWRRMSDSDHDKYPPRMSAGDWDEQLISFHYNHPIE